MSREFNARRASEILCEAFASGDKSAAARFGVSTRTIANYRARLKTDPEFASLFQTEQSEMTRGWHVARRRLLLATAEKARELVGMIKEPTSLLLLITLMEKVGSVDSAAGALGLDRPPPVRVEVDEENEDESADVDDQRDHEDPEAEEDSGRKRAQATPEG